MKTLTRTYFPFPECTCLRCQAHRRWNRMSELDRYLFIMANLGVAAVIFFATILLNGGFQP